MKIGVVEITFERSLLDGPVDSLPCRPPGHEGAAGKRGVHGPGTEAHAERLAFRDSAEPPAPLINRRTGTPPAHDRRCRRGTVVPSYTPQ